MSQKKWTVPFGLALLCGVLGGCGQRGDPLMDCAPAPLAAQAVTPRTLALFTASSAPTTQGWTASVTKSGSVGGQLVSDGGQPAWKVDGVSGRAQWLFTPGSTDKAEAAANGWRITSVLRLESGGYVNDYYANGSRRFLPILALSNGNLTISLEGGVSNLVLATGTAATAYHTYVQEFDPATARVTLTFDGVRVATWSGAGTTQNYVAWGDGSSSADSVAYYRSVRFEIASPARLERDVFTGGRDPMPYYRIPSLTVLPSGTLVAGIQGMQGTDDPGAAGQLINITVKRSTDQGVTWSAPQVIAADSTYDYSDPRLVTDDRSSAVFAFYTRWPDDCGQNSNCNPPGIDDPRATALFYRKSTDDGQTWGSAVNINVQVKDPTWRTLNSGPGNGVQLKNQTAAQGGRNGRLIFPAIVRDGNSVFYTVSIYSDDGGATWKRGTLAPTAGATEGDLTELADGRLLLSARNDGSAGVNRYHLLSSDGGLTWTNTSLGGVRVARVDTSIVQTTLNGGSKVLLSAPLGDLTATGFAANTRSNLGLWISSDQGATFPTFKHLAYGFAAYSATIPLKNGNIGVLYETTPNTTIHFSSLPPSALTTP